MQDRKDIVIFKNIFKLGAPWFLKIVTVRTSVCMSVYTHSGY